MEAPRVLVVDDEESIQMLLREALTSWGYQVTCVGSGLAAIAALEGKLFDAALTDIRMPRWTASACCVRSSATTSRSRS